MGGLTSDNRRMHIVYVGSRLPALSETFVYREVFGLRRRGHKVTAVSVYKPGIDFGSSQVNELSRSALVAYRPQTFVVGLGQALFKPSVMLKVIRDAISTPRLSLRSRAAVLFQGIVGMGFASQLKFLGVEHVHAHMANTPTGIAMYMAASLGVPFSFTGHAADLFRDRLLLEVKLERATFVACISHWHRAFYQSLAEVPNERLPIIRCGIDVPTVRPVAPPTRKSPAGVTQLLTVGRLVEKKGIHFLLQALSLIEQQFRSEEVSLPALKLTVVGEGPERVPLEETCHDLGLDEMVAFTGSQPNARVRSLMKESDLFVLPCCTAKDGDRDGIPVVLMEAMAAGLPVISGDLPTIRELVVHEQTGLLVVPDDVFSLAQSILNLVRSSEYAAKLAKAGQDLVCREFSLDPNLIRLEEAINGSTKTGEEMTSGVQEQGI